MNEGVERNRVTPTYTSSVFPLQASTPIIKNIKSNSNLINKEPNESSHEVKEDKWAVSKEDIIPEKAASNKNKVEFYKKYMGINDTPFQRLFKELHGSKAQAPVITNVKKQLDTIGLANQTINRRGVYEDLDAKGRRAKEFDSCIWAENNGNYKSFNGEDLTLSKRNKLSSTVSWLNKHTEVVNNADRDINPSSSTKDQLSSHVLPMDDYSTASINPSSHKDLEHEAEQRRELEFKMSNAGFKKIDRSGNQQK